MASSRPKHGWSSNDKNKLFRKNRMKKEGK